MKIFYKSLILLTAACTAFCGCSSPSGDTGEVLFKNGRIISQYTNLCNDGELYTTDSGKLIFMDFSSMQSAAICSKPNCTHTDSKTCSAFGMGEKPVFYNGSIYFLATETVLKDKKTIFRTSLSGADRDGTNRSVLYTIEGYYTDVGRMFLYNGVLYFILIQCDFDENGSQCAFSTVCLFSYNFQSGKFLNIGKLCEGYSCSAWIHGLWNKRIYLSSSYSKTEIKFDIYSPDVDYINEQLEKNLIKEEFQYSLDDGKLSVSDMPAPFEVKDGYYVAQNGSGIDIYKESGEKTSIDDISEMDITGGIVKEKLFMPQKGMCYDIPSGKFFALNLSAEQEVIYYIDGFYITKHYTCDENKCEYKKIAEVELIGGEAL